MNANLEKVLKVLKHRGSINSTSDAELAKLSGLSRKTINKYNAEIANFLASAPKPSRAEEASVDKKIVETYVELAIAKTKDDEKQIANILGAVAGYVLRQETNLINDVQQQTKVIKVGTAFINVVAQIQARKDNKGTPIHSKNKSANYLLNELNKVAFVDKLFIRSKGYQTGAYSKRWKLTSISEQVIESTIHHLLPIIRKQLTDLSRVTLLPAHIPPLICVRKSVTYPKQVIDVEKRCLVFSVDDLAKLSIPSLIQVFNLAEPSKVNQELLVPLHNLADVNPNMGRTYNIFTRLKSDERKALGYINYDISGGIQIIAFGILFRYASDRYREADDLISAYYTLFNYGWDPEYKQHLRQTIAAELKIEVSEVKQLLTAYANGSKKQVGDSATLAKFQQESDLLRREVIAVIAQHEPDLLKQAEAQSRHSFPEELDWTDSAEDDELARQKASVFFFIWTYFEKQIRDAMLSIVDDGIPVHDAIYSQQKRLCKDFEEVILKQTGFEVKVSH